MASEVQRQNEHGHCGPGREQAEREPQRVPSGHSLPQKTSEKARVGRWRGKYFQKLKLADARVPPDQLIQSTWGQGASDPAYVVLLYLHFQHLHLNDTYDAELTSRLVS